MRRWNLRSHGSASTPAKFPGVLAFSLPFPSFSLSGTVRSCSCARGPFSVLGLPRGCSLSVWGCRFWARGPSRVGGCGSRSSCVGSCPGWPLCVAAFPPVLALGVRGLPLPPFFPFPPSGPRLAPANSFLFLSSCAVVSVAGWVSGRWLGVSPLPPPLFGVALGFPLSTAAIFRGCRSCALRLGGGLGGAGASVRVLGLASYPWRRLPIYTSLRVCAVVVSVELGPVGYGPSGRGGLSLPLDHFSASRHPFSVLLSLARCCCSRDSLVQRSPFRPCGPSLV